LRGAGSTALPPVRVRAVGQGPERDQGRGRLRPSLRNFGGSKLARSCIRCNTGPVRRAASVGRWARDVRETGPRGMLRTAGPYAIAWGLPLGHIRLTDCWSFLRGVHALRHTLCGAFLRRVCTLMRTPAFYDRYRYSIALCLPLGFEPAAREVRATRAAVLECTCQGGHFWGRKMVV
jgi:hypothetical protein